MDCSMPGFPVYHQFLELAQTHVHWVGDDIQPSHPLSYPSPPAFNLSQHQGLFQWVNSLHQVAKVLELQIQHQSFQLMSFRIDWFDLLWGHCSFFLAPGAHQVLFVPSKSLYSSLIKNIRPNQEYLQNTRIHFIIIYIAYLLTQNVKERMNKLVYVENKKKCWFLKVKLQDKKIYLKKILVNT